MVCWSAPCSTMVETSHEVTRSTLDTLSRAPLLDFHTPATWPNVPGAPLCVSSHAPNVVTGHLLLCAWARSAELTCSNDYPASRSSPCPSSMAVGGKGWVCRMTVLYVYPSISRMRGCCCVS